MTRYEILLGIAPPLTPPEYVMGVDLGIKSDTVCCICHRGEDCIHLDHIFSIKNSPDHEIHEIEYRWGIKQIMADDGAMRNWKDARTNIFREKYKYSDEVKWSDPRFLEYLDDVSQGHREFIFKNLEHQFQNRVDALTLAVHMLRPKVKYQRLTDMVTDPKYSELFY